jgi:hypothetical protein
MFPMIRSPMFHVGHYIFSARGPVIILWLLLSIVPLQLSGPVLYLLRTIVICALFHGYSVETYCCVISVILGCFPDQCLFYLICYYG